MRKKSMAADHLPFTVYPDDLKFYSESPQRLRKLVLKAFEKEYFKGRNVSEEDFNGEQLLNLYMIGKMLERLIQFDKRRAPFIIHGLEREIGSIFLLKHKNIRLNIGGVIDRLEEKAGKYYILDYKTGGKAKECQSLEALFEPKNERASHIFQTFVYALALLQKEEIQAPVVPVLLYMQQAGKEDYSPFIRYNKEHLEDFRPLAGEFKQFLLAKIDELFDPTVPFQQTEAVKTCEYCSFREMCNR
jgi:CRISPR/Cas system-associated exonuclease Cas4 (RecB family)